MNYLYHWVPKDMRGNVLYPLNTLKDSHADLYEKEASKYVGREHIMEQRIPVLDCLWNDVLHFSAVHPSLIKKALFDSGRTKSFDLEFFEVDPHLLNSENTIVYLYKHSNMADKLKEDNFAKYDPDDIAQYSTMPEGTKEYYKEMFAQDKNPLLFHKVPHILFKGSLDVSGINKIKTD
ncbi:MAG TPA: hypothetical protein VGO63_02620 [Candidatus Paceibacterota bacterium]|jgi:hypothetical protein|nr:hypothetical protein [Candidatus Paceibacterota bacterium]